MLKTFGFFYTDSHRCSQMETYNIRKTGSGMQTLIINYSSGAQGVKYHKK